MVNVVIINNDLDSLLLMSDYLEKKGIEVIGESLIAKDALELYKQHHPDIVIIDSNIPEEDRELTIRMIKSYYYDAKIISILNNPLQQPDRTKVSDILIKPYKIEELVSKINYCYKHDVSMISNNILDLEKTITSLGFEKLTNSESEVLDFIHNVPKNCHPKLLFKTESFRDNILKEYFNPKFNSDTSSGFFGRNIPSVKTTNYIKYKELIDNNQILVSKVESFFENTISSNHSKNLSRFACEDTVWFKEHGLFTLHQVMSQNLKRSILEKSSIFCCYDITRLTKEHINSILENSQVVILENPLMICRKAALFKDRS